MTMNVMIYDDGSKYSSTDKKTLIPKWKTTFFSDTYQTPSGLLDFDTADASRDLGALGLYSEVCYKDQQRCP